MTTLIINIKDDKKVADVVSFLSDIEFLDVLVKEDAPNRSPRRSPAKQVRNTRIIGDIAESVVPEVDWEILHEAAS